jgi:hypothetical protein
MPEGLANMTMRRSIQQPEGNDSPGIIAAPLLLLGIARLEVSVIVDTPTHGVVDSARLDCCAHTAVLPTVATMTMAAAAIGAFVRCDRVSKDIIPRKGLMFQRLQPS